MLRSFSKVMFTSKKIISTAKLYNFETQNMYAFDTELQARLNPMYVGERELPGLKKPHRIQQPAKTAQNRHRIN